MSDGKPYTFAYVCLFLGSSLSGPSQSSNESRFSKGLHLKFDPPMLVLYSSLRNVV